LLKKLYKSLRHKKASGFRFASKGTGTDSPWLSQAEHSTVKENSANGRQEGAVDLHAAATAAGRDKQASNYQLHRRNLKQKSQKICVPSTALPVSALQKTPVSSTSNMVTDMQTLERSSLECKS